MNSTADPLAVPTERHPCYPIGWGGGYPDAYKPLTGLQAAACKCLQGSLQVSPGSAKSLPIRSLILLRKFQGPYMHLDNDT